MNNEHLHSPRYTVAQIEKVSPDSLAEELGLQPGDCILRINGKRIKDLIEYYMEESAEELLLEVEKVDGEIWEIDLEKEEDQGLGVTFSSAVFDRIKRCRNHCVFCFVDQMPPDLRPTLYIKDDDYRLSFLQGSYVTLSNLDGDDWERIKNERLSPLYISVHATDPDVREVLFGNARIRDIMSPLKTLASWGIHLHTQAVIVPEINDGLILKKTIFELAGLWPNIQSLAIVPVGLTKYRHDLPKLRRFNMSEAVNALEIVHSAQNKYQSEFGTRFVFAADELYIQAKQSFPELSAYEDLWQLENGVGLWVLFREEFKKGLRSLTGKVKACARNKKGDFLIITGMDAAGLWPEIIDPFLSEHPEIQIEIRPVLNRFFGEEVTVTGLITGTDIIANLKDTGIKNGQTILIPQVMLRQGEMVFLDGTTVEEIRESLSSLGEFTIKTVEMNGEVLVKTLLGLEE